MNVYDDIMNPTGNNNKVILTSQNIFSNSECIFVEYYDVISCPWYVFILNLIKNNSASEYFNFQFNKNTDDLEGHAFDWYIHRKFINPFFSVGLKPAINELLRSRGENYEEERALFLNKFLYESMNKSPEMFNEDGYLNFTNTLKRLISIPNLVKKVIIYSETYHKGIDNDIKSLYGDNVLYTTGDLVSILNNKSIPKDTTYVFSDINKIYALIDTNRIDGSSILIADKFGYNYDKNDNVILNPEYLQGHRFNISTFDNIHELELK